MLHGRFRGELFDRCAKHPVEGWNGCDVGERPPRRPQLDRDDVDGSGARDACALRRMPARSAGVYQTLVSVSAYARRSHELGFKSIRRCRRYLRLIDPTLRVWSHSLEEISMKPFERQPHPITLTAGIVAVALVVLVLASMSVRRADNAAYATNVAAVATSTVAAAAEGNSAIRRFRVSRSPSRSP
jgi:hypothetical protein